MRRRFNKGQYWERVQNGELSETILGDNHPTTPAANQPFCTRSQMISYREQGNEVARVHQYLLPNGTLGASGRPDPKRLFEDDILYRLVKKHHRSIIEP